MENNPIPRRRFTLPLIGGVLLLVLVRGYYEFLVENHADYYSWFAFHSEWRTVLIGAAVVTTSTAAWLVHHTSWSRLALPVAMVVGAATTALYLSIHGAAVGLVVGLGFTAHRRSLYVRWLTRVLLIVGLPLALAIAAGLVARAVYFSDTEQARLWTIVTGLSAAILTATIVYLLAQLKSPVALETDEAVDAQLPGEPPTASPSVARVRRTAVVLTLVFLVFGFLPAFLIGWRLDVHRRHMLLNQVGAVYFSLNLDGTEGDAYFVQLGDQASDRHLVLLRGLPSISEIAISGAAITDEGCKVLASMRNLRSLRLDNVPIHDKGLAHIAGMPVQWLFVRDTAITRESFRLLETLPNLTNVVMEDVAQTGPRLADVSLPLSLREAHFPSCGLTDDDLAALGKLTTRVRQLTLSDNQIRGPGLAHVAPLIGLGTLDLNGNPLDDQYLAQLAGLPLSGLRLNGVRLTEAGVAAIEKQPTLELIAVQRSGITDDQMQRILSATRLADAELDGNHLTAESIKGWSPRDVRVFVEKRQLDASDIERLGKFDVDVYLIECELTDEAVGELSLYSRLFHLERCRAGEAVVSGLYPVVVPVAPPQGSPLR